MTVPLVNIIIVILTTALVPVDGLGSASTAAVVYGTDIICGIVAGQPTQHIQCYNFKNQLLSSVLPNVSFQEISGGRSFFCGLRHGGYSLHCWDTTTATAASLSKYSTTTLKPKRIYHSDTVALTDLAVGESQVCALEVKTGVARCWRGGRRGLLNDNLFPSPGESLRFRTITCGSGFACGILKKDNRVVCWGGTTTTTTSRVAIGAVIQMGFENFTMSSLVAGESHACGLTTTGILVCKGNNDSGQLDVPSISTTNSAYEFSSLALGSNFTCGIQRRNGLVTCWGGLNQSYNKVISNVSLELIVSGSNFVCGLTTSNLSIICWSGSRYYNNLPMGMIIPGACVKSSCSNCGTYPNSEVLCYGSGNICRVCEIEQLPLAVPLPSMLTPPSSPSDHDHQPGSSSSKAQKKLLFVFLTVGLVGSVVGFSSIVYCVWTGILRSCQSRNNNEEPRNSTIRTDHNEPNIDVAYHIRSTPELSPSTIKSKSSQSTGSSRPETFSVSELAAATNNFSLENKIGGGSFGIVYKGKLSDGREVAIKRGHSSSQYSSTSSSNKMIRKKFQEKEIAFDSELDLLSRLNHKHLVSLVGFCSENDERLLVYDYMNNGSLHSHLHNKSNDEKNGSVLINSWKMRIKIALEAAKGIDYLQNYAVPPVIHRDIKSSNILLDSNWTARVSDFGLSTLMIQGQDDILLSKAVGTVGYIDPEYYVLNALTSKSDVYGLGVVMLELLTGKRAVFRNREEGVTSIVDYAGRRRRLLSEGVLDKRVATPKGLNEAEAVEVLADTAMRCVKLEGTDRPHIAEVVSSLERALSLCNC